MLDAVYHYEVRFGGPGGFGGFRVGRLGGCCVATSKSFQVALCWHCCGVVVFALYSSFPWGMLVDVG